MDSIVDLIKIFLDLINTALPVVAGLALLVFIWGLVKFISRVGGDEKAIAEGKSLMVWGLVALFIMASFMGIIAFFSKDLGFGDTIEFPYLPEPDPND